MLDELREEVCAANRRLAAEGLARLTWGNTSGIDRREGLVVIKPSGVPYQALRPRDLAVVDLDGNVVDGELKPSSDLPTHLVLYRHFHSIGGIAHAHSSYATTFAQACREIPCLGTTHADHFAGTIPVTRALTAAEIEEDYTGHTGRVIVERMRARDPAAMPAVLVAHHGPFAWGASANGAVDNAVALETVAEMAFGTLSLRPDIGSVPDCLSAFHFARKHGDGATYGQRLACKAALPEVKGHGFRVP